MNGSVLCQREGIEDQGPFSPHHLEQPSLSSIGDAFGDLMFFKVFL